MAPDKKNGSSELEMAPSGGCPGKKGPAIEKLAPNDLSDIKNVVAVMSGKGGVGKSTVTAIAAIALARAGKKVGILDADLTGPSIPKLFGATERPTGTEQYILPVNSRYLGIKLMSMNLLLGNPEEPVIWRGPIIGNAIKQFWTDVAWGDVDYLFVDLPPGTGDAPLTVMQSLPINGLIMVTAPQELAILVVKKALNMARLMNIPIYGFIENMAYFECGKCGEKYEIFGPSRADQVAAETGMKLIARMPIDPKLTAMSDAGEIEKYESPVLEELATFFSEQGGARQGN